MLTKYAELVIKLGVNLQQGANPCHLTPPNRAPFVRTLTETLCSRRQRSCFLHRMNSWIKLNTYMHRLTSLASF